MIIESVFGLFLMMSSGKADVDPTTTILRLIVKENEIQKIEKKEDENDNQ